MKILYVITGLAQGGAERVVCDLADAMCTKGHTVKIAYLTGSVLTKPKSDSIELIAINLTGLTGLPFAYVKISQVIKSYRPDVVHSHMVHANILARLIRLSTPVKKLITTAHSSNEGGGLRMLAYRITNNLSDLTTNVSSTAVNSFECKHAVPKGKMQTIYNGVNFENFFYDPLAKKNTLDSLGLPDDTKLVLAVGRFSEAKNYPNLLHAIKDLKELTDFKFRLLIAGDGELRPQIEQLITHLGLEDYVILLGRRGDIQQLMSACDLFVLSSDHEGLPTVLIEALACQAHIVSTDVSGVREVVNRYATVVPPKNSQALAQAILKNLSNVEKNIQGRYFAKSKFDLNKVSEEWLSIYNEI